MRAYIISCLTFLLISFNGLSQQASPKLKISPFQTIEIALSSYSEPRQRELRNYILTLIDSLRSEPALKNKILPHSRKLKDFLHYPNSWQKEILKNLYPLMDKSEELELLSLQSKGLYSLTQQDPQIQQQYNEAMEALKAQWDTGLPQDPSQIKVSDNILDQPSPEGRSFEKLLKEQVQLKNLNFLDGIGQKVGIHNMTITDTELQKNARNVLRIHEELIEKEIQELKSLNPNDPEALKKHINRINTDKIMVGSNNGDHPIGKAKKTLVYEDDKKSATLIAKVILDSKHDPDGNAHIVVPKNFNLESLHFQEYILNQHKLAGSTDFGFGDLDVLNETVVKNPFVALYDYSYDFPNAEHRLKKNIAYWKAQFNKKIKTRGRNVYIYVLDETGSSVEKVIYSPRANIWNPKYWKSGQGFKEFKKVFVKKSNGFNYGLGFSFGLLQSLSTIAVKSFLGQEEAALEEGAKIASQTNFSAHLSLVYATVIGGNYGTFNKIVKNGKKVSKVMKNFAITTLTFGYTVYLLNYLAGVESASLNIFGEQGLQALENHYKIWVLGIVAKFASEPYKALTDSMKDARLTTGNKISLNIFGKKKTLKLPKGTKWFNFIDQAWHLVRTTLKNTALEVSLMAPSTLGSFALLNWLGKIHLSYGGFEFWGNSQNILMLSMILGTVSTYTIGKLAKIDKRSDKAAKLIKGVLWFGVGEKIDPLADKGVNGIYKLFNKIKNIGQKASQYCSQLLLPKKVKP